MSNKLSNFRSGKNERIVTLVKYKLLEHLLSGVSDINMRNAYKRFILFTFNVDQYLCTQIQPPSTSAITKTQIEPYNYTVACKNVRGENVMLNTSNGFYTNAFSDFYPNGKQNNLPLVMIQCGVYNYRLLGAAHSLSVCKIGDYLFICNPWGIDSLIQHTIPDHSIGEILVKQYKCSFLHIIYSQNFQSGDTRGLCYGWSTNTSANLMKYALQKMYFENKQPSDIAREFINTYSSYNKRVFDNWLYQNPIIFGEYYEGITSKNFRNKMKKNLIGEDHCVMQNFYQLIGNGYSNFKPINKELKYFRVAVKRFPIKIKAIRKKQKSILAKKNTKKKLSSRITNLSNLPESFFQIKK